MIVGSVSQMIKVVAGLLWRFLHIMSHDILAFPDTISPWAPSLPGLWPPGSRFPRAAKASLAFLERVCLLSPSNFQQLPIAKTENRDLRGRRKGKFGIASLGGKQRRRIKIILLSHDRCNALYRALDRWKE